MSIALQLKKKGKRNSPDSEIGQDCTNQSEVQGLHNGKATFKQ